MNRPLCLAILFFLLAATVAISYRTEAFPTPDGSFVANALQWLNQ